MAISPGYKANFEILLRAAENGDLALMECADAVTGRPVYAVCCVNRQDGEYEMVPIAKLFDGNPFEELLPPAGPSVPGALSSH